MASGAVTITDIAARLGISASTVGRALSDDHRISASMKQRVLKAAKEMGYVANHAARMMRGASSNLIGLMVPDIRNSFYSTIAHALAKCLEPEGFRLTLSETDDNDLTELQHVRALAGAKSAGIIIVPSAQPHPDSIHLLNETPHIQLLRWRAALSQQWFGIDDAQALFQAATHLLQLGHRRIAYIGSSTQLPTGRSRVEGFQAALAGVEGAQGVQALGAPESKCFARNAIRRLLAQRTAPTAVVTGSVQHTLGMLDALAADRVRVPEELSVVGFGDEPAFRWWGSGLTTVTLPVSELATACGLWFVHQVIRRKSPSSAPYSSLCQPTLVVRGSTSPLDTRGDVPRLPRA